MSKPYRLDLLVQNHLGRVAHVFVDNWTEDDQGKILLSPECRTFGELEHAVQRLKDDLDQVLKDGRKEFAKPRPPLYAE
ncbi:MAG: hypothetical protein WD054_07170 [Gemmatimonadota bacterium]